MDKHHIRVCDFALSGKRLGFFPSHFSPLLYFSDNITTGMRQYADPTYQLRPESDIFSLGLVLQELFGMKPVPCASVIYTSRPPLCQEGWGLSLSSSSSSSLFPSLVEEWEQKAARQAKRRKTVGVVVDARGDCACGIESRATSNCAVVKRKSSRTSKRYTDCAAAFTGWKHRQEHPERTAEARRRLGDGRRRRKRRRRQKWSEAWKKMTREVIPPNSNSNCNWPADACGALRRRVGGHRPPRRRRGRSGDTH